MPLQFQPPPDWLVQNYVNRQNPVVEGLNAAVPIAQLYMQQKQQQQTQQSTATKSIVDLIGQDPELLKTPLGQRLMKQSGADLSGYQPPSISTPTTPSPQAQTPEPTAGTTPQGSGSPIIDHWNQTVAAPQAPGAMDLAALAGRGKLGKAAVGDYKTGLDVQKLQRELAVDPNAPVPVMTKEAAVQAGSVNPRTKIVEPPTAKDTTVADAKREDRLAKAVTDYGKQIENHPVIKALNAQQIGINQVDDMIHLVQSGNTVASSAMGTKMARAMGEVGVLTESDIKRYVQSGKLTQGAADKLSKWITGKPTDATLQEIGQISNALKDSFASKVQPIYDRHINRFSRAYKMTPQEASHLLDIPYAGSSASGGTTSKGDPLGIR